MYDILSRLQEWPRSSFVREPTPLLAASNLAHALERRESDVLVKMDAETSFGLGGNKARKLEFELAPPRLEGVTCVITCGGPQSNHARLTAAACARLDLRCVLVVNGDPPDPPIGNAYLQSLFGAEVRSVPSHQDRDPAMAAAAAEVEAKGGKALIIPLGASTPLGALGYVRGAIEIADQWQAFPTCGKTWVFASASSCGTCAGLALGFALLKRTDVRLVGVSPDVGIEKIFDRTGELYQGAAELLGTSASLPRDLLVATTDFIGPGYGVPTDASEEAASVFARTEGIVLDPVYTAKTAAAMLAWARTGQVPAGDRLVLWHTGGYPTAFVPPGSI